MNERCKQKHNVAKFFWDMAKVALERENKTCKFWLEPLGLARSHGFGARESNVIRRIIQTHRTVIVEAWHEHCG